MRIDNDREMVINREREGNIESQIEREKERSERVVEREKEKEERVRDKKMEIEETIAINCNLSFLKKYFKISKSFKKHERTYHEFS